MSRGLIAGAMLLALTAAPPGSRAEPPAEMFNPGRAVSASNPFVLRSMTASVGSAQVSQLCRAEAQPVTLNLFPDVRVRAEPLHVERSPDGTAVRWGGRMASAPDTTVLLSATAACGTASGPPNLSGTVQLPGRLYAITPAGPGKVTVSEYSPGLSELDERRVADVETPAPPGRTMTPKQDRSIPGPWPRESADCVRTDYPVIDLLVLWSPKVTQVLGGPAAARARVDDAIAMMNSDLTSSQINARVRLVHAEEATGYTGPEDDGALDPLRTPGDGVLDQAQTLRDTYGADLVSIFTTDGTGIGTTPVPPSAATSNRAYSQANYSYLPGHTFSHELGHNLGAHHDWVTDPDGKPGYEHNHGYSPPSRAWRTIMSYGQICQDCERVGYFSNPRISFRGEPAGVAGGDPKGDLNQRPADNSRMISETSADPVSKYRAAVIPAALCELNVTASPEAGGSAAAQRGGPYSPGTTVAVTATPKDGYVFSGWTLNGQPYPGGRKITVPVAADTTLVANFVPGTTPKVKLTFRAEPSSGGYGEVPGGPKDGVYTVGTTVTTDAYRYSGQPLRFAGWSIDGVFVSTNRKERFTLDNDTVLTAHFAAATVNVTTQVSPDGSGTVNLSAPGPYPPNSSVTATATPAAGQVFRRWLLDGQPAGTPGIPTLAIRTDADHTITAEFGPRADPSPSPSPVPTPPPGPGPSPSVQPGPGPMPPAPSPSAPASPPAPEVPPMRIAGATAADGSIASTGTPVLLFGGAAMLAVLLGLVLVAWAGRRRDA